MAKSIKGTQTEKNLLTSFAGESQARNKYSYFARINELEPGDEIVYTTKYGERKYIVDTKKEILETDWSNLEGTSDNRLTLITCIKNKVNQRLCVQAVQENI